MSKRSYSELEYLCPCTKCNNSYISYRTYCKHKKKSAEEFPEPVTREAASLILTKSK